MTTIKANKQPISANCKKSAKTLIFSDKTITKEYEFPHKPVDTKSNDEDVEGVYTNDTTVPTVATSNQVNGQAGIYTLTIDKTYKRLGWKSNCNVISTHNMDCTANAIHCLITLFNILKINVPPTAIEKIKNISNLDEFNLNNIVEFLEEYEVTLTPTNQEFEKYLGCNTMMRDTILIVSTNKVHTHEENFPGNSPQDKYVVMLSILIQQPPFLLFPSSSIGTRIINRDWGHINK